MLCPNITSIKSRYRKVNQHLSQTLLISMEDNPTLPTFKALCPPNSDSLTTP